MARFFSFIVLVCFAVTVVFGSPRPEEDVLSYGVNIYGQQARSEQCDIIQDFENSFSSNLNLLCREKQDSDDDLFNSRDEVFIAQNSMSFNGQSENIQVSRFDEHAEQEVTTPDAPRN